MSKLHILKALVATLIYMPIWIDLWFMDIRKY